MQSDDVVEAVARGIAKADKAKWYPEPSVTNNMFRGLARAAIAAHDTALKQQVEVLREDAARYRWLRDHSCPPHNFYIAVPDEFNGVRYSPTEVDAYIDAARTALAATEPNNGR